ncbi:MAG: hypothetical protein EBS35_05885, partial [Bacteroidetes bacterium]|nr:hypothetical protein [Bacteroidota bacterium]
MILIIYWKKLKINFFFSLLFYYSLSTVYAQDTLLINPVSTDNILKIDTTAFIDSSKIKLPPNPKKAAFLSLILPGAGQI